LFLTDFEKDLSAKEELKCIIGVGIVNLKFVPERFIDLEELSDFGLDNIKVSHLIILVEYLHPSVLVE